MPNDLRPAEGTLWRLGVLGDTLRAYELLLCEYAHRNVPRPDPPMCAQNRRKRGIPDPGPDQYGPWLLTNMGAELAGWALSDYGDTVRRSLSSRELERLRLYTDGIHYMDFGQIRFEGLWEVSPEIHLECVSCVPELRERLCLDVADAWHSRSRNYAFLLEETGLKITDGFRIVRDWIAYLRLLLKTMTPTGNLPDPKSNMPTPATPEPVAPTPTPTDAGEVATGEHLSSTTPPPDLAELVAELRQLFIDKPKLTSAKPKTVRGENESNNRLTRAALRWLEARSEYTGFASPPKKRKRR